MMSEQYTGRVWPCEVCKVAGNNGLETEKQLGRHFSRLSRSFRI